MDIHAARSVARAEHLKGRSRYGQRILLRGKALQKYVVALAASLLAFAPSRAGADEPSPSRGGRIYDQRCSNCHGDELQNNSGIAFDLRQLKADEHDRFVGSVLYGKRAMPSWQGALTMEQIDDLWAYVRAHAYQQ
jgi:mono/diheme cytochrome c family protein